MLADYLEYTHVVHADASALALAPAFEPVAHALGLAGLARGAPAPSTVARDILLTLTGAANEAEALARAPPALVRAVTALADRGSRFLPAWPVLSVQAVLLRRRDACTG